MKRLCVAIVIVFVITGMVFIAHFLRRYQTKDDIPPVISAESDSIIMSVHADGSELLNGMSAYDDKDGDVSDSLMVVSRSVFVGQDTVVINYAAFDSHDNVGTYSQKVVFSDYVHPRFSLSAPLIFSTINETTNFLANVTCMDCLDGDITSRIKLISSDLSDTAISTNGKVDLFMQVTNSVGDTQTVSVSAIVQDKNENDKSCPAFSEYLWYVKRGEHLDIYGLVSGIRTSRGIVRLEDAGYTMDNIFVDDALVRYDEPGTYVAAVTLHEMENVIGTTDLYIVVED